MRRTLRGLVLTAAWLGLVGTAGAQDAARAVIERAVRAQAGSADKLDKMANMTQSMRGAIASPGGDLSATRKVTAKWPDHFQYSDSLNIGGQTHQVILTLKGDEGWRAGPEGVTDMSSSEVDELRAEVHASWLTTLLPLRDGSVRVAPLPEAKVNGKPAAGLKVTMKGRPDTELYFDKASNLLVKVSFRAPEAGLYILKEWVFSNHKRADGLTLPTKLEVLYDGRKAATWAITEYDFPSRLAESAFQKP